jgi:hypothetical protein
MNARMNNVFPIIWLAFFGAVIFPNLAMAQENQLFNGGLEGSWSNGIPSGWSALWTRDQSTGILSADSIHVHGGSSSMKVAYTGTQDWSEAQNARLSVRVGDVVRISAWVKCESTESAEISVVLRNPQGQVIDWMYGKASTGGTHDWEMLSSSFVIPAGGATIQFRFTGYGKGTSWVDDASLVFRGNVESYRQALQGKTCLASNPVMEAAFDAEHGLWKLTDLPLGESWQQTLYSENVVVTKLENSSPLSIVATLWDIPNDLQIQMEAVLLPDRPEIKLVFRSDGPMSADLAFPQPFQSPAGSWLIVPMNEGILYPADDSSISPMRLITYGGHGISMPWFGIVLPASGAGLMTMLDTPDDASIDLVRPAGGNLMIRPLWEGARGKFNYSRSLTYVLSESGGYVSMAKRYREKALAQGLLVTLREKARVNPFVDLLIGAANIWNWDMDKVVLCREMRDLGMDRILWSGGGAASEIASINQMGFLSSRYDIFQDVWPPSAPSWLPHEGWPDDLVLLPNGDWMRGWAHYQTNQDGSVTVYEGGVICSSRQVPRARQRISDELKTIPYHCRFIDTTTASPWRECYNPNHPLNRTEDRQKKMELLDVTSREMGLVTGTETGIDPSVPYVHYYEGMLSLGPYRLPDAGRDMLEYKAPTTDFLKFQVGHYYRIPLWELVYHDCTVSMWYWGDYNNKVPEVWARRDLFNILYGTPPMYMFSRETWQSGKNHFAESYQKICPLIRRLGYDEMISHEFLTADHSVQLTRWRNGTEVIVNLGDVPYTFSDGRILPAMDWISGNIRVNARSSPQPRQR